MRRERGRVGQSSDEKREWGKAVMRRERERVGQSSDEK